MIDDDIVGFTRNSNNYKHFCGPNRSFPCNDCRHVATAKAFLNRSKFSAATKKRIAACINRKSVALGCGKGKPAKAKGAFEELSPELRQLAESDIFKSTKELMEASLKIEGGMDLDFSNCEGCE